MKILNLLLIVCVVIVSSCASDADDTTPAEPQLIIKLKFDPTQARLNNLGQPSTIPAGNAAQSPTIRRMSANYIEFAPSLQPHYWVKVKLFLLDQKPLLEETML